jgi:hypothetical protein
VSAGIFEICLKMINAANFENFPKMFRLKDGPVHLRYLCGKAAELP